MTSRYRINELEKPDGTHVFTIDQFNRPKRSRWVWDSLFPRRITETKDEWWPLLWSAPGFEDLAQPWEFPTYEAAMQKVKMMEFRELHGESRFIATVDVTP